MRKKVGKFKCLMLVLRGNDIENSIEKVYNRQKMKFKSEVVPGLEDLSYKPTPHVLFMTNQQSQKPVVDFILDSKYVNLFQDTQSDFDYLNANCQLTSSQYQTLELKTSSDLLDQGHQPPLEECKPVSGNLIIKPNQAFNVVIRSLKAVANINPDQLKVKDCNWVNISKIEMLQHYSQSQIDLLWEHDIQFDNDLRDDQKASMK
jgi:hypothetical protein